MNKYWQVKMQDKKTGELLLYGDISSAQQFGDEVTPKQIDADLKALGKIENLNVRINSGGGSVFAAQAIYTMIKRHDAKNKTAYIDGLAASAASFIPIACHRILMASNAMMMVHSPFGVTIGNADEIRKFADVLDKLEEGFIDIYKDKTGLTKSRIKEMLSDETWMNAREALNLGFIDEIEQDKQVAAALKGDTLIIGGVKMDLSRYHNFDKAAILKDQAKEFHRIKKKIYGAYEREAPPQKENFSRLRRKLYKPYENEK